jgi:biopolymer transport protein ExbD
VSEAKIKARVRRRLHDREEAAEEGGEINLVPYLDIVTNIIIFLLATITAVLPLGDLSLTTPRYENARSAVQQPPKPSDRPPLNLTVSVSGAGFTVAGSGGTMYQDDIPGKIPTIPKTGEAYDYVALTKLLQRIKGEFPDEGRVILVANADTPYEVVVRVMDTLREPPGKQCTQACVDRKISPNACPPEMLGYIGECLFPEVVFGTGG